MIVDTNGWLLPFRSGTRLESEIDRLLPGARPAVPTVVLAELGHLVATGLPNAAAALALAERAPRVAVRARGDAGVIEAARQGPYPILTADRELRERAARAGLRTLRPRGPGRLALDRVPLAPPSRSGHRRRSATVISATRVQRPTRRRRIDG